MKYARFDPPALLTDFKTEAQRREWSALVREYFREGVDFNRGFPGVTSQFYDPTETETDSPFDEPLIEWPGFPKLVRDRNPADPLKAWRTAEAGAKARTEFMDEYLEWHVVRNAKGKITRVSFTCETSQYYDFLARTDRKKLLALYKGLVDPARKRDVRIEDLVVKGRYRSKNKWNTKHGAVHLLHENNTLRAEVLIAAQACILRRRADGTPITDSDELIECADYGKPGRASDPRIGAVVNERARAGYSISLRNPVALYITHWDSTGWRKPSGAAVGNYWKLVRGSPSPGGNKPAMGLHLVYEVPAAEGFVVGDVRVGNLTIEYGGQVAERVNVGLFALLCRKGQTKNPGFSCANRRVPDPQ